MTWLIPALFALQVQANVGDSTEFFQQQEVLQVILDGEFLYDDVGMEKVLCFPVISRSFAKSIVLETSFGM